MTGIDINGLLQSLGYGLVITIVPILATKFLGFLDKLANKVETESDNIIVANTINEVFSIISSAVASTSQTYVDSLKASGNFSEEAQKKAFTTTKETILKLLSEESKDLIKVLYNDLDAWLDIQIESEVNRLKNK